MDFVLVDNCRPGRTVYEGSEDCLFSYLRLQGDVALKSITQELRNGADLESVYCGVTFIGAACWLGRYDVVQLVIDFLKEEKRTDVTRCHISCSSKPRQKKSLLDSYDTVGNTPLLLAISGGHLELCQLLLENGVDINRPHQCSKQTPLLIALEHSQDEMASYLIQCGADVQLVDNVGITPLYVAIKGKKEDIVKQLIAEGCDVNIGSQDHSPIFLATRMGQRNLVKVLVESGCHRDISNKYGVTPVYEAALKGHVEVLQYLLEEGCNPNLVDMYNQSPLHVAVMSGHLDCVKLLVEGGVNWKLRNHNGDTAADLAISTGKADILEYLMLHGIDVFSTANCTRLRKHLAFVIDQGHLSTLHLLIRNCSWNLPLMSCPGFSSLLRGDEELLKLFAVSNTEPLPCHVLAAKSDSDWLRGFHNNPRSLKDLCRNSIRQTLGKKVLYNVNSLPLPSGLKKYITLAHL